MTTTEPSTLDPSLLKLKPVFNPSNPSAPESPAVTALIQQLSLQPHPEGGYFTETDRDPLRIPNPLTPQTPTNPSSPSTAQTRSASTSIFYLLTPSRPQGHFHTNAARTVHTLHKGRGRYVILHPAETQQDGKVRVESFVVGQDVSKGERLQWVVEGGRWKGTFLLEDQDGEEGNSREGLLISETVVPGFEYVDHMFLSAEGLGELVGEELAGELEWLVRRGEKGDGEGS